MSSAVGTMWAVYGSVDRYLHNPRLMKPADLGTVIPFLLLGILSFVFAAAIVPPAPKQKAQAEQATPLAVDDGTSGEKKGTAGPVEEAKAANAPSATSRSPSAKTGKRRSPRRAFLAEMGMLAGWGWWAFALILCAVYEVKVIFGSIVMVAFGIVMTISIIEQLP